MSQKLTMSNVAIGIGRRPRTKHRGKDHRSRKRKLSIAHAPPPPPDDSDSDLGLGYDPDSDFGGAGYGGVEDSPEDSHLGLGYDSDNEFGGAGYGGVEEGDEKYPLPMSTGDLRVKPGATVSKLLLALRRLEVRGGVSRANMQALFADLDQCFHEFPSHSQAGRLHNLACPIRPKIIKVCPCGEFPYVDLPRFNHLNLGAKTCKACGRDAVNAEEWLYNPLAHLVQATFGNPENAASCSFAPQPDAKAK